MVLTCRYSIRWHNAANARNSMLHPKHHFTATGRAESTYQGWRTGLLQAAQSLRSIRRVMVASRSSGFWQLRALANPPTFLMPTGRMESKVTGNSPAYLRSHRLPMNGGSRMARQQTYAGIQRQIQALLCAGGEVARGRDGRRHRQIKEAIKVYEISTIDLLVEAFQQGNPSRRRP